MTGFILLLAIQLTGLSCLDEWYPPHASLTLSTQSLTQTVGMSQTGDDACPCHLAFVSAPKAGSERCYLVSLLDIEVPMAIAPAPTSLPFHPPLAL
jgi:hypothetical protein